MSGDCDSVALSDCSADGPTSAQRSSITGGVWVDGIHVCLIGTYLAWDRLYYLTRIRTVEPLYRGHHRDSAGCPVYSGTSL